MIGGTDIIIPTVGSPAALDACVRIVEQYWPQARFEDALTGQKYSRYADLPISTMRELLIYPDAVSEAAWDADSPDAPTNSMIYLILSSDCVTVVLDDPATAEMRSILESIRNTLGSDVLHAKAERG